MAKRTSAKEALSKLKSDEERAAVIQAAGVVLASIISAQADANQKWTAFNLYVEKVIESLATARSGK